MNYSWNRYIQSFFLIAFLFAKLNFTLAAEMNCITIQCNTVKVKHSLSGFAQIYMW